jgi:RNA polymerase sigma-70 factor (ECF subfamily)
MLASKPSPLDDLELIRQYKASGDLEILGQLFTRYTSLVFGVCLNYLRNREEAKDTVMQVFEKLVQSLKEHNVENFKGWLYVSTRNQCLMYLRARKGKFNEEISPELMENELFLHPEEEPEIEQNITKLEKCIEQLAEKQRWCVQLFFLEEKCYKDITNLTGFDLNKVKSYIQNGKRNLKICMELDE